MKWEPIETAPWNTVVLLIGDSGYCYPHNHFVISGYRQKDYRGKAWLNVQSSRLSDFGIEPTHWMPLPELPPKEVINDNRKSDCCNAP